MGSGLLGRCVSLVVTYFGFMHDGNDVFWTTVKWSL